jgi:hypothetical protein
VKPGNLILRPGVAASASPLNNRADTTGDLIFESGDGAEFMRFHGNGVVTVRGEQVDNNPVVYERLKEWLWNAKVLRPGDP